MGKKTTSRKKKKQAARRRRMLSIAAICALALAAALFVLPRLSLDEARPAATEKPTAAPSPTARPTPVVTEKPTATPVPTPTPAPTPVTITISAAGDCTLGGDFSKNQDKRFQRYISKDGEIDLEYCFENVRDIFMADDLSIVNLEVVLTESSDRNRKDGSKFFYMRGKPAYARMLPLAGIDAVNIANNHMTDFGEAGIQETIEHVAAQGVGYFGYEYKCIREIKGVTVGLVGFNAFMAETEDIERLITETRAECDLLIVSFHWGRELEYKATTQQTRYGRAAVNLGADLVIGHHPHVVNGIEVYKDVNIVYSLGNFCFGGNSNPKDKDTFIYQHSFTFDEGKLVGSACNIIPCTITSKKNTNDFRPTPATGARAKAILQKLEKYSRSFDHYVKATDFYTE